MPQKNTRTFRSKFSYFIFLRCRGHGDEHGLRCTHQSARHHIASFEKGGSVLSAQSEKDRTINSLAFWGRGVKRLVCWQKKKSLNVFEHMIWNAFSSISLRNVMRGIHHIYRGQRAHLYELLSLPRFPQTEEAFIWLLVLFLRDRSHLKDYVFNREQN